MVPLWAHNFDLVRQIDQRVRVTRRVGTAPASQVLPPQMSLDALEDVPLIRVFDPLQEGRDGLNLGFLAILAPNGLPVRWTGPACSRPCRTR